jgi:hypothetical protein
MPRKSKQKETPQIKLHSAPASATPASDREIILTRAVVWHPDNFGLKALQHRLKGRRLGLYLLTLRAGCE